MDQLRAIAPGEHTAAVDPDASDPTIFSRGTTLYVGTGGDVCVQGWADEAGTKRVFKNVGDGCSLPVAIKRVWPVSDGTTAEDLVAVW